MTDDAELLRRYAEERSEEAFAELVRRHLGLVYGAALRQLNGATHRAEEVAQSVFIDLARKAASLARRTEIAGWLYTSTHHAAAMLKRSDARREEREKEAQAMHEIDRETVVDWNQIRPVLDDAMLALPEPDRVAVLLRFFQDRKLAEVGQRIGLGEDAARMRIDRALDKLRTRLQRHGISSTSAALAAALGSQAGIAAPAALVTKVTGVALAGGATAAIGTGALVHIWNIMSTSKTIAGVSGVIALLALGTATYQTTKVRALATNATALEQERGALATERDGLRRQTAELSRALEEMRKSATSPKPTETGNQNVAATGTRAPATRPVNPSDVLMNSPEYMMLVAKNNAAKLGANYAAFYRRMNFSPGQIDEFERLMTAQINRGYDVATATWLMGIKPDDAAYAAAMQKNTVDTTASITEWVKQNIGAEGGAALMEYNRAKPVREWVRTVAAETFDSPTPLTTVQGEQLVALLTQSSAAYRSGTNANPADINWNSVLEQASAFLAPNQLRSLTGIRDQRAISQQMAQLAQKLQKEAAQGGK